MVSFLIIAFCTAMGLNLILCWEAVNEAKKSIRGSALNKADVYRTLVTEMRRPLTINLAADKPMELRIVNVKRKMIPKKTVEDKVAERVRESVSEFQIREEPPPIKPGVLISPLRKGYKP